MNMKILTWLYRKFYWNELRRQLESYYEWKVEQYPNSARSDKEYLLQLLKVTEAKTVTDISESDIKKYLEFIGKQYKTRYYLASAGKSVRCFIRHYRAKGFPTIMPFEMKAISK